MGTYCSAIEGTHKNISLLLTCLPSIIVDVSPAMTFAAPAQCMGFFGHYSFVASDANPFLYNLMASFLDGGDNQQFTGIPHCSILCLSALAKCCWCHYLTGLSHRKLPWCLDPFILHVHALQKCLYPSCILISSGSAERASGLKILPSTPSLPC